MRVKYNDELEDLYCIECKSRIEIGNKYIESKEYYLSERIIKCYHIDCCPPDEDEVNDALDITQEVRYDDDLDMEDENDD